MNILLSLYDFVPVILFTLAAIKLQKLFYSIMNKGTYALFCAGTIMIISAGIFKATWKILYYAEICDFQRLNQCFFPMQSLGFMLSGIAVLALTIGTRSKTLSVVPVFSGTLIFVVFTVLGTLWLNLGLAKIALDRKKKSAAVIFTVTFLLMLCMGYLSSKDFSQAYINFIAQTVNCVGQGLFLIGTIDLEKDVSL